MRALVTAMALICAGVASATASEYALTRARTLYTQMQDRSQCEAVLPSAREFWRSADFNTLPAPARTLLLRAMAGCAWELADGAAAIAISRDARENGADWADYMLMQLGLRFDDDALALESFHRMAEREPDTLAAMPWRLAWRTISAANDVDQSGREALRIHDVLVSLPYRPLEGGNDDSLRMDHARLLIEAGQVDRARARLEGPLGPEQVILMRVDGRYAVLRDIPGFAARLDVRAAAEADLERARANAAENENKLSAHNEVAGALRVLGRHDEALALIDQHVDRAQTTPSAYSDTAEQLNWAQNERAYTLYELGRADEARAAFGLSIAAGEDGSWNVSQVINFASMLVAEQRPQDALEVLQIVGRSSDYGDMWIAAARACAAAQLADAALQQTALTFLRENTDDNIAAAINGHLCANDLDAVAALYIARLSDPAQRGDALLALQRYHDPPNVLPYERVLEDRLNQVRARADVRAAVDAVGQIEDIPVQSVYWGDF